MTTDEYRKADGVNFSSLKHILKSPAHYQANLSEDDEPTQAMIAGTLAHAMILEGKNLLDLYAIKPEGMRFSTKEGKAWRDAQTLPILESDTALAIPRMAESIVANPYAYSMLKGCQHRETPLFANLRGVDCKALLDAHGTDNGEQWVICDLKTTDDASPEAFAKKVANLDYDMQKSFYSQVLAQVHQLEISPMWFWIVVEKSAPFTCAVYSSEQWDESGDSKLERALELYKQCIANNQWPQPFAGITTLERPKWA